MEFNYTAIDESGATITGVIDATNDLDAIEKIRQFKLIPVEVTSKQKKTKRYFNKTASLKEWLYVMEELTSLLEANVVLIESVKAIVRSNHSEDIKDKFKEIESLLTQGSPFSVCLEKTKVPVSAHFIFMVKAGEMSGELPGSLREALDKINYENRIASELRTALIYPSVLITSGIAAVFIIFTVVVPKFAKFADGKYDQLPFLSQFVMKTGIWFNENLMLVLAVIGAVIASFVFALKSEKLKKQLFQVLLKLPLLGDWLLERESAVWTSTMASLLRSRVNILQALDLTTDNLMIPAWKIQMKQVTTDVQNGLEMSNSLESNKLLTPVAYNMVSVGEKTGKMADMLSVLARVYSKRNEEKTKRVMALVEPAAILLIGGVIAVLVIGIVMTITSINQFAI